MTSRALERIIVELKLYPATDGFYLDANLCFPYRNGLRIVLADVNEEALKKAAKAIADIAGGANVISLRTDVSKLEDVQRLKERAYEAFGEVSIWHCDFFLVIGPKLSKRLGPRLAE